MLNEIKTGLTLLVFMIAWFPTPAQYSFEYVYINNGNGGLYYTFETSEGNFLALGSHNPESGKGNYSAKIIELDAFGNLISDKTFTKQDSSFYFSYGFQKSNGNYFLVGASTSMESNQNYSVTCVYEVNQELETVWQKQYRIPEHYRRHRLINFVMDTDSVLLIQGKADSSLYSFNDLLYFSKINREGDLLEFKFLDGWKDQGNYGSFFYNFDSTGYVLMGEYAENGSYLREWVELDLNLDVTNTITIIDPDHLYHSPLTAKWLSDGNLIVGHRYTQGNGQDMCVRILDQELNPVADSVFDYQEYAYLPYWRGLDFRDENTIWVASFEPGSLFFPGTEIFRVFLFDSSMNLKGTKEYGGDHRYNLRNLIATSDGGCLITGSVPDFDGSDDVDGYLIKLMPDCNIA